MVETKVLQAPGSTLQRDRDQGKKNHVNLEDRNSQIGHYNATKFGNSGGQRALGDASRVFWGDFGARGAQGFLSSKARP